MRFLVIGANGQLGRDLSPRLDGEVVPVGRDRADLTHADLLCSTIEEVRPDLVVNCAAFNLVDRAEVEFDAAFGVNALGVRNLAQLCGERGLTLVHFSSDYVFGLDPGHRTPWREEDAPGPISVYGATKLVGEYFVRFYCPRHFIIRSCGLYGVWGSGGKGGNFVETMLRLAAQGKPIRVVADQVCTPTYTVDLAAAVVNLLKTQRYGVYHVTNRGATSWHDFAAAIFELSRLPVDLAPTTTAEFGAPARRPAYSVLAAARYEALGFPAPRFWREALAAYLVERGKRHSATPVNQ